MLAKRWREHGDTDAAAKLVNSHLRLVAKIAMGYRGYGLPVSELISEGNIGLMQGVKKFEPERGFRARDLCDVVDPRLDPGIHPALVEPGEDGHHRGAEETVLQPAPDEEPDRRVRGRRPQARRRHQDRHRPRRDRGRGRVDEPPHGHGRRHQPQRAAEEQRGRRGPVAGLPRLRGAAAGRDDRRGRGKPGPPRSAARPRWKASTTARSIS